MFNTGVKTEVALLKKRIEDIEEEQAQSDSKYSLKWVEKVFLWIGSSAGLALLGLVAANWKAFLQIIIGG